MGKQRVEVIFAGGKRIDVRIGDFLVRTDQSRMAGGEASAPEPFDLFLASIAACAGIFALNFCIARDIGTDGLGLRMECEKDERKKLYSNILLHLRPPPGFPERYRSGIVKAMELCTVKRHIADSPEFSIVFDD
jgi:ribosomal protein S12 methylthiotransferase accessory factor